MIPEILYEDDAIIVVHKPAGMESQSGKSFSMDMCSFLKNRLARQGVRDPYIGVVHRLDRMVSGVMVYAKTREAAAKLSRQVQNGQMEKHYKALLCGQIEPKEGMLVDYLLQNPKTNCSAVAEPSAAGAKEARLTYRQIPLEELGCILKGMPQVPDRSVTGVEIHLLTGRHHQIRVQFAHKGTPLFGDTKYNPAFQGKRSDRVALCAYRLSFRHPVTDKPMEFILK